jgi:hypothetical protein
LRICASQIAVVFHSFAQAPGDTQRRFLSSQRLQTWRRKQQCQRKCSRKSRHEATSSIRRLSALEEKKFAPRGGSCKGERHAMLARARSGLERPVVRRKSGDADLSALIEDLLLTMAHPWPSHPKSHDDVLRNMTRPLPWRQQWFDPQNAAPARVSRRWRVRQSPGRPRYACAS